MSLEDKLQVRTRSGREVAPAVKELAPLTETLSGRSVVLDDELVAGHGRGFDFCRLGPLRATRRRAGHRRCQTPVCFVAFDLLYLDGNLLTALPYVERRALLEELRFAGPAWSTMPSYPGMGAEVFASCFELGLEGLVAKRLSSRYRPGKRTGDWVKAKPHQWVEVHAPRRLRPAVSVGIVPSPGDGNG